MKIEETAIGFLGASKIPGVVEFSLCLFFPYLLLGGILGGTMAGIVSSTTHRPAIPYMVMKIVSTSTTSTAVSAELGQWVSIPHWETAAKLIIDGTGSEGAAIWPFLAGALSGSGSRGMVFDMLYISDLSAFSW